MTTGLCMDISCDQFNERMIYPSGLFHLKDVFFAAQGGKGGGGFRRKKQTFKMSCVTEMFFCYLFDYFVTTLFYLGSPLKMKVEVCRQIMVLY